MELVPADFAEEIFDELEGVDWLDWTGKRPVTNFRNHIRMRWQRTKKVKQTNGYPKDNNGAPDRDAFTYAARRKTPTN
jgi:hypothetical protein